MRSTCPDLRSAPGSRLSAADRKCAWTRHRASSNRSAAGYRGSAASSPFRGRAHCRWTPAGRDRLAQNRSSPDRVPAAAPAAWVWADRDRRPDARASGRRGWSSRPGWNRASPAGCLQSRRCPWIPSVVPRSVGAAGRRRGLEWDRRWKTPALCLPATIRPWQNLCFLPGRPRGCRKNPATVGLPTVDLAGSGRIAPRWIGRFRPTGTKSFRIGRWDQSWPSRFLSRICCLKHLL